MSDMLDKLIDILDIRLFVSTLTVAEFVERLAKMEPEAQGKEFGGILDSSALTNCQGCAKKILVSQKTMKLYEEHSGPVFMSCLSCYQRFEEERRVTRAQKSAEPESSGAARAEDGQKTWRELMGSEMHAVVCQSLKMFLADALSKGREGFLSDIEAIQKISKPLPCHGCRTLMVVPNEVVALWQEWQEKKKLMVVCEDCHKKLMKDRVATPFEHDPKTGMMWAVGIKKDERPS